MWFAMPPAPRVASTVCWPATHATGVWTCAMIADPTTTPSALTLIGRMGPRSVTVYDGWAQAEPTVTRSVQRHVIERESMVYPFPRPAFSWPSTAHLDS